MARGRIMLQSFNAAILKFCNLTMGERLEAKGWRLEAGGWRLGISLKTSFLNTF